MRTPLRELLEEIDSEEFTQVHRSVVVNLRSISHVKRHDNETAEIQSLFQQNVVPSDGRFDIVLSHGAGSQLWDVAGKRYLDLGGGIAIRRYGRCSA